MPKQRLRPGGVIAAVKPGSLGEAIGLRAGDRLVSINGYPLRDIIDVQFYAAEEILEILVEREGKQSILEVERDYGEELGLSFTNPTFDVDIRRCANNCDFCFVKQNAPEMRRSLYIKDDDYRYSFLYGNFVTLTNLTDQDWMRLEEQRLDPLYVSVHATDLALRRRLLGRPEAPDVVDQLNRLAELEIKVHTQVVLIPGLNDGEHLAQTIRDLTALYREPVASVSIVPVGLTKFHRGRCRTYTPIESRAILDRVEGWRIENSKRWGCRFVYPSDEWYLVTEQPLPLASEYDGFPQVENGVGMVRQLLDEWREIRASAEDSVRLPVSGLKPATLVCGTLIAPVLAPIVEDLATLTGGDLRLLPVVNRFFGSITTVSGLLTGQDVVATLQGETRGEFVLLPRAMFTGSYGAGLAPPDTTVDDMSLASISDRLGVPVQMAGTMSEVLEALTDQR